MNRLAVAEAQERINHSMVLANGILQRKCDKCKKKKTLLQRASIQGAPDTVHPIVYEVLRSQGQPLDPSTRKFMEARFGKDFSHVRIYTDSKAAESANAINAIAYTMGRNIVFGPGKYTPHLNDGQKLIAHELTHVIQQFNHLENIDSKNDIIRPQDAYEHEADMAAMDAMAGRTVHISPISSASIQRVAGVDDAAEVSLAAVASWCVTGALATIAVDEIFQFGKSIWKGIKFKQNWCDTLFSALYGCVFGIAGGALEKMFLAEYASATGFNIAQFLIKNLKKWGYTQLSGKLSLTLVKLGCNREGNTMASDDTSTSEDDTSQLASSDETSTSEDDMSSA